jgi:UDP-N-acetylmuramate dehydrogenase
MLPVLKQFDLRPYNTLSLQSQASDYVALHDIAQLEAAIEYAKQHALNVFVLSGGSNLLLPERVQALTLHMLNQGQQILREDQDFVYIKVQAGENWHDFVCGCCAAGHHGLENLALIPGRVGAAPIQNIGAYGVEVGEFIEQIWAYDLQLAQHVQLTAEQCQFGYRESLFKRQAGRYVIYALSFKLRKHAQLQLGYADVAQRVGCQPSPKKLLDAIIAIRTEKLPQPAQYPNVGSFFKNPLLSAAEYQHFSQHYPQAPHYLQSDGRVKLAAGWLIDQAGWKGKKLGPVGMFERQALVLVNYAQASLQDVQRTYQAVQADIWQKFAIHLEPEPVQLTVLGQVCTQPQSSTLEGP